MSSDRRKPRTPQVALLIETSTEYGRGLLRGILRYSRLHGPWLLHVAPGHFDQPFPKSRSWGGTGIIARIRSPEMEKMVRATGLPFVASSLSEFGPAEGGNCCAEIRTESAAIARMGASQLRESGFHNFAFCGFANCHWSMVREKEFLRVLRDGGHECFLHRVPFASWTQLPNWINSWERERPLMVSWVKSLPKPVGLMACNDVCGREVLQACASACLKVPDEVAVIGVDNDEMMCELSNPPLSSVALDIERAGYEAARCLDQLMGGEQPEKRVVWVCPTQVVTRRSSDVIAQEDSLIAAALRLIRERAGVSLSVGDINEALGVSRRTLERRFFRAVGRTPLSEIMRCHMQRAKQLLLETDLPCHRVAGEAGFGSVKTFNRTFSRQEGTTPVNFRRRSKAISMRPMIRKAVVFPHSRTAKPPRPAADLQGREALV